MSSAPKRIDAVFYRSSTGREPVREWLRSLETADRRTIGFDIATAEFGWPIGMPICRSLGDGLWEIRSDISNSRIARVIFCIIGERMVLLHGFVKKAQKTPKAELEAARRRRKDLDL